MASCSASKNSKTKTNIKKQYGTTYHRKESTPKKEPYMPPTIHQKEAVVAYKPSKEINNKNEHLIATSDVTVSKDAIQEYVDLYKNVAMDNMREYGIPASIKLAQGILESGSGKGKLCREANNHFGIKCKETWTGATIKHTDDAPNECFRKYDSAMDSYKDHSEFLAHRVYYKNLFTLDKSDYVAWANGLKKAGYATDAKYPQKLISIIERYNLYEYDRMVLGTSNATPSKNLTSNTIKVPTEGYYSVTSGDTLYAISTKFDLSIDEIKRMNNLQSNVLSVGQVLRLR